MCVREGGQCQPDRLFLPEDETDTVQLGIGAKEMVENKMEEISAK